MKKIKTRLCLIMLIFLVFPSSVLAAGSATISWQANTESDLAGYRIYYGTEPGVYGSTSPLITGTSYTITGLQEGKTFFFVVTAVDTAGNESGYSSPVVSKTIPVTQAAAAAPVTEGEDSGSTSGGVVVSSLEKITPIPLPAVGEYGKVAGLDPNQDNEVNFSFMGTSGPITINYEIYDVNSKVEIQILINGRVIGYAPVSGDDTWLEEQSIVLPDEYVNDSGTNVLTFNNTVNPPTSNMWGVRDISIE